jgi:ankyrin repeat protein
METLLRSADLTPTDTDSLEKRNFSTVHKIIFGISNLDLEEYLKVVDPAEINQPDSLGRTPLCWASSRQNPDQVDKLLRYGASPHIADQRKQSPLHYCAGSGAAESMKHILVAIREKTGTRTLHEVVDARDSKGRTPLNFATRMNFPVHVQLLLSFGADTECVERSNGRTIILEAIYWNSHKTLPLLLNNKVRTDVLDIRSASILHYAARFADSTTLTILANHDLGRLDTRAKDDQGLTPLDIFNSPHLRCVSEAGVIRDISVTQFRTILHNAAGSFDSSSPVNSNTLEHGTNIVDISNEDEDEDDDDNSSNDEAAATDGGDDEVDGDDDDGNEFHDAEEQIDSLTL